LVNVVVYFSYFRVSLLLVALGACGKLVMLVAELFFSGMFINFDVGFSRF